MIGSCMQYMVKSNGVIKRRKMTKITSHFIFKQKC